MLIRPYLIYLYNLPDHIISKSLDFYDSYLLYIIIVMILIDYKCICDYAWMFLFYNTDSRYMYYSFNYAISIINLHPLSKYYIYNY